MYYFHLAIDAPVVDNIGSEFYTLEDAVAHARKVAFELNRNDRGYLAYRLRIVDATGEERFTLRIDNKTP